MAERNRLTIRQIHEDRASGLTQQQLALRDNITQRAVSSREQTAGLAPRPKGRKRMPPNPQTIADRKAGLTVNQIAERDNVSTAAVYSRERAAELPLRRRGRREKSS